MVAERLRGRARSVVLRRHGGVDVLEVDDVEVPPPAYGQLEVAVAVAGVNFMDVYHRRGDYDVSLPVVPGIEGAGTVVSVGSGVDLRPGDRVAFMRPIVDPGAYADRVVVDRVRTVPLPDDLSFHLAAAVLIQGVSAHYLAHDAYPIREGDIVLVHAASGGLGLLLVQLAKQAGARVIGTVSSEAKARAVQEVGVDHIIDYTTEDVVARVRDVTDDGVHAVYDGVGAATFDRSLAALRPRGTIAVYGTPSGDLPPLDTWRIWDKSLKFTRTQLKHHAGPDELPLRAFDIFTRVARGELQVRIDSSHSLETAGQAHARLEERRNIGKVLIVPEGAMPAPTDGS